MCHKNLLGLITQNQWNTSGLLSFHFLRRLDILYPWSHAAFSTQSKQNKCSVHITIIAWPLQTLPSNTQASWNLHTCWRQKDAFCKLCGTLRLLECENFPARRVWFFLVGWFWFGVLFCFLWNHGDNFFPHFFIFWKKMFQGLSNSL